VLVAVVLILAGGGWLLGVTVMGFHDLNPVKNASGPKNPGTSTHQATKNVPVSQAELLDPEGADGSAKKNLDKLFDGDATSIWKTEGYRRAAFGNLKKGMGVTFDLGSPTSVKKVHIVSPAPGASVQLFAGDSPTTEAPVGTPLATSDNLLEETDLVLPQAKRYQYWTLWFTSAGKGTGDEADAQFPYKLMIGEVTFSG
jgi:hypothetical protein